MEDFDAGKHHRHFWPAHGFRLFTTLVSSTLAGAGGTLLGCSVLGAFLLLTPGAGPFLNEIFGSHPDRFLFDNLPSFQELRRSVHHCFW
jgi:hypothetical protein